MTDVKQLWIRYRGLFPASGDPKFLRLPDVFYPQLIHILWTKLRLQTCGIKNERQALLNLKLRIQKCSGIFLMGQTVNEKQNRLHREQAAKAVNGWRKDVLRRIKASKPKPLDLERRQRASKSLVQEEQGDSITLCRPASDFDSRFLRLQVEAAALDCKAAGPLGTD